MLHDSRLLDSLPDIRLGNLDMATSFARIIEQNAIANDARLALGKITPLAHGDQWTSIPSCWGYQESEEESNEESDQALDEEDPSPSFHTVVTMKLQ
ncbi:hypothetical protein N7508_008320 [Penicillium antarcticum]|uniref:uncharacterized protein n=1 Tax=Penicillium antarcticum TaxID=416450 RepID=UPI002388E795|nr:uncharacterized protein N7508_008320 [Penicillium antarcticum]KAJ5298071.1 hypothetical protein N7508_008320 [Penicillium antarcticum]